MSLIGIILTRLIIVITKLMLVYSHLYNDDLKLLYHFRARDVRSFIFSIFNIINFRILKLGVIVLFETLFCGRQMSLHVHYTFPIICNVTWSGSAVHIQPRIPGNRATLIWVTAAGWRGALHSRPVNRLSS